MKGEKGTRNAPQFSRCLFSNPQLFGKQQEILTEKIFFKSKDKMQFFIYSKKLRNYCSQFQELGHIRLFYTIFVLAISQNFLKFRPLWSVNLQITAVIESPVDTGFLRKF